MRRLLVLLVLVLTASTAQARVGGWLEPSVMVQHNERALGIVSGGLTWSIPETSDQLGLYGFFWIQEGWAQVYFGPTYTPKGADWLTLGVHLGMEQIPLTSKARLRYAASVAVAYQRFAFYGVTEFCNEAVTGKDRSCIMYDLTVKGTVWGITQAVADGDRTLFAVNVGGRAHRMAGIGPYLEFYIPVGYTTIWLNWVPIEPENWTLAVAPNRGGNIFNWSRFWLGAAIGF